MKRLVTLFVLSMLSAVAIARPAAAADDTNAVAKPRFATLAVVDDESDPFLHTLTLDGKEILRHEGAAIVIETVYSTKRLDLVLVALSSGGNACPVRFVIVQLEEKKPHLLSEVFGTCTDLVEPRLDKDALIIEMPNYANHPELWDEKELEEAISTKRVYTWSNGKLTEKRVKK